MRHSFFYPSAIGFLVGVLIRSLYDVGTDLIFFIITTSCVLIVYIWKSDFVFERKEARQYSYLFLITIFVVSGGVGCLIVYHAFLFKGDQKLDTFINSTITLKGIIISEADERESGKRFHVKISSSTNVIMTDDLYSHLQYGDEISMTGKLEVPEDFETENGRVFHYKKYLAKDSIFFKINNPEIEVVGHHKGNKIKELLFKIKDIFVTNLDKAIPYPQSTLAAGITIAGKKALPKSIEEEFQRTGTLQVVVLSGYNITIVAEAFMSVTQFLSPVFSASLGGIGIIIFTIMAGGSATVVRGSIMSCLVICTRLFKTRYNVLRALTIAAVSMVIINPYLLVFDPSFQLSFLATLGLILVSPIVEKHLGWITEHLNLRQVTAATIATQIFVTPFILYSSGDISIVALPANMLIFLCMPLTMLTCFITGMSVCINVFLAVPTAYISYLLLWYELTIVHIFSSFSFASVQVNYFPWWVMLVVYNSFAVFIWRFYKKESREKKRHTAHV
jgi:competence protein ComEC